MFLYISLIAVILLIVVIVMLGLILKVLNEILNESILQKQSLSHLASNLRTNSEVLIEISGNISQLNDPLEQYKKKREFDEYRSTANLDDILK